MKTALKLFFALTFFITTTPAYASDAIGEITMLEGTLYKLQSDEKTAVNLGDKVLLNDELETGESSFAKITFTDKTSFSLGEKTILKVDDFVYTADSSDKSAAEFSVTRGAFHYVSGLIAKEKDSDIKINIDFGSIGIRGTQIWRDLVTDKNGKPMCRIYVEKGEVDVSNSNGKVTLGHKEGTSIKGAEIAPTKAKKWRKSTIKDIKSKVK